MDLARTMISPRSWLAVVLCALLAGAACGSTLRVPPSGPQPETARQVIVDYPPPPARVERVPPDPGEACFWIDGHWEWRGRAWEWESGNWFVPPPGCHYASPRLAWIDTARGGTLYFTPPGWYPSDMDEVERSKGKAACKPPVVCRAGAEAESPPAQPSADGG
jgi:hypothetical protein